MSQLNKKFDYDLDSTISDRMPIELEAENEIIYISIWNDEQSDNEIFSFDIVFTPVDKHDAQANTTASSDSASS